MQLRVLCAALGRMHALLLPLDVDRALLLLLLLLLRCCRCAVPSACEAANLGALSCSLPLLPAAASSSQSCFLPLLPRRLQAYGGRGGNVANGRTRERDDAAWKAAGAWLGFSAPRGPDPWLSNAACCSTAWSAAAAGAGRLQVRHLPGCSAGPLPPALPRAEWRRAAVLRAGCPVPGPAGWTQYRTEGGEAYYHNAKTQETT